MSNSVRPHRWKPTRLPHPWDSPGKNTGVGCHFLLQCMKSESEVAQLCLTLCDPMDCSLPGSSIHGIFKARVLECVAISFSNPICEDYINMCVCVCVCVCISIREELRKIFGTQNSIYQSRLLLSLWTFYFTLFVILIKRHFY